MMTPSQADTENQAPSQLMPTTPSLGDSMRATQRFVDALQHPSTLSEVLREMRRSGELSLAIPEFTETWGPRGAQSPDWHPEGSVWTHTLMVIESLPRNASRPLTLAAVFHDIGKPATFFQYPTTGGIAFPGHAHVGADLFQRVIGPRLGIEGEPLERAAMIIDYHMFMHDFFKPSVVRPEFQEHILKLPCIHELIELQHADVNGTGISPERKVTASYRERFYDLLGQQPPPIK